MTATNSLPALKVYWTPKYGQPLASMVLCNEHRHQFFVDHQDAFSRGEESPADQCEVCNPKTPAPACKCEANRQHHHHVGPCKAAATVVVVTIYGTLEMCQACADSYPAAYKVQAYPLPPSLEILARDTPEVEGWRQSGGGTCEAGSWEADHGYSVWLDFEGRHRQDGTRFAGIRRVATYGFHQPSRTWHLWAN